MNRDSAFLLRLEKCDRLCFEKVGSISELANDVGHPKEAGRQ
jgi:hypothetical protein